MSLWVVKRYGNMILDERKGMKQTITKKNWHNITYNTGNNTGRIWTLFENTTRAMLAAKVELVFGVSVHSQMQHRK